MALFPKAKQVDSDAEELIEKAEESVEQESAEELVDQKGYFVLAHPYILQKGNIKITSDSTGKYTPKDDEEQALLDYHVIRGNIQFLKG